MTEQPTSPGTPAAAEGGGGRREFLARAGMVSLVAPAVLLSGTRLLAATEDGDTVASALTVTAVTLAPASAFALVGAQHTLTATIAPVGAGETVRFKVTAGPNNGDTGTGTTDASGKATFTYTGDGGVGTDTITAWIDTTANSTPDAGEPQATASARWLAAGTAVALSPDVDTNVVGTQHSIEATVTPAAEGVPLRLQISAGPNAGESLAMATAANGKATFTYLGDGGVGIDTIAVWVDLNGNGTREPASEPWASAFKQWTAPTISSVVLSPSSDSGLTGSSHTVTATIAPAAASIPVRFRVTSGPNTGDTGVGVTNASGQATFSYVGDGGTGLDTITAWFDANGNGALDGGEPQASAVKLWTTSGVLTVSLSPVSDTNAVNTQHTVTATIAPVQAGQLIRVRVVSGPNAGDATSGTTNASGQVSFTYLGDGGVGTDVITAWHDANGNGTLDTGEAQATAVKQWTLTGASTLAVTPATASNVVNSSHTVTATVTPAQAGLLIRFKVVAGPNLNDTGSATTNASGQASFSYVGDGGVGTDVISAWHDANGNAALDAGEAQAAAVKHWTLAGTQSLTLTPATDTNPVGTYHTVTATAAPAQAGLPIRFRVLSGPNAGDTDLKTTNGAGQATFSYKGDGGAGADTIVAWHDANTNNQLDAGETQAIATKTWSGTQPISQQPGEVRKLDLTSKARTVKLGTTYTVRAKVHPQQAGVIVRFRVVAGPNIGESGTGTTDGGGNAYFSWLGDGGEGTDFVAAWVERNANNQPDGDDVIDMARVRWRGHLTTPKVRDDDFDSCEDWRDGFERKKDEERGWANWLRDNDGSHGRDKGDDDDGQERSRSSRSTQATSNVTSDIVRTTPTPTPTAKSKQGSGNRSSGSDSRKRKDDD